MVRKSVKKVVALATVICLLISCYGICFAETSDLNEFNIDKNEYKVARDYLLGSAPVRVDNTPVRKSKSDNSELVLYLSAGDIVFIYNDDTDETWASVSAKGKRGFVRLVDINLDEMEPASIE